ncbi:Serine/threonine-protein kinase KIN4 [Diplogelasinospora grovesii]|uniref:non-specific serine/threonine protein kinase n=1 Tax=Diplogelasinospora grovesii TaxID=303347 RepID=A0AAN6S389_9PEZI|nr:Serine/threonine-protein kinase KIN4 [Diplogelasinospora grovesii]
MSTALQTAPLQPTSVSALNTPPLLSGSPSNRHYPSSHSSPSREGSGHHANQQTSGPPTATSSRSSRRPSASDSQNGLNSQMSSRAAISSPVPVTAASSEQQQYASGSGSGSDRRRNMPAAVPPRTSSTQHTPNGGSSSRRAPQPNERATNSPRQGHPESGRDVNGNTDSAGESSRSRRGNAQMNQEDSQRSGNTRDSHAAATTTTTTMPIRSPPVTTNSSKGPSREASEILNSILISQPEVDIAREKERAALAQPHHFGDASSALPDDDDAVPPPIATAEHGEESRRGGRSRHDHSKREKHTKFGEYILGNTIGEGEFGKVKLGWKQEGGVQVAIKLIKKDQLGSNPSRMAKIMREVAILKQLTHPNIVRLHKMEESERHYGIVLEYASGGELFDYILNHRYLKDNAARRLFAQLVSGVGYLHKKGIVHRDLKLENLLLDRNKNIIITDFGFANTFDPNEELSEEEELNLSDREFVKRLGLDKIKPNGSRKGDLMQTSCGSPCYAAPELVVSDSLYTGRKVDVWSCGVILYAMLAGYLPFDDDPANPEGDNINLLYKYIVNTPLTFPEYVTPHARDLLRRILVPNPRKRADLFEVARHSWLSEYAHVVEFITSSTTTPGEIQNTTVPAEDDGEAPVIQRSASVREGSKKSAPSPAIGGLTSKQGTTIDAEVEAAYARQQRENKRRTVQVEYVAPNTTTQRGEPSGTQPSSGGKTRARSSSQGPVEVVDVGQSSPIDKPLPQDPPVSKKAYGKAAVASRRPPSAHRNPAAPARPGREARAISDTGFMTSTSGARPPTGGSMQSTGSRGMGAGGRASYGQPVPPELADTNVHGRIQQPPRSGSRNYGVTSSSGLHQDQQQNLDYGRPSISVPPKFAKVAGFAGDAEGGRPEHVKGHRRSNTLGELSGKLFGRSGSVFGGRNRKRSEQQQEKTKKYPPVSMNNSIPPGDEPRTSMDSKRSRRSFSIGLGKKRSGSVEGSQASAQEKHTRRFSFIPASFSLKAIGIGRDYDTPPPDSQQDLPIQEPPALDEYGRYIDQDVGRHHVEAATIDNMYTQLQDPHQQAPAGGYSGHHQQQQYGSNQHGGFMPGAVLNSGSEASVDNNMRRLGSAPHSQPLSQQDGAFDGRRIASSSRANQRSVLQKNKRFVDAWDSDSNSRTHDHSGSSGPARKVMDFFRRRGKARTGES